MSTLKLDTKARKKTRKFLFQKLYAQTFGKVDSENFDNSFYEGVFDFDIDHDYLNEMFSLVCEHEKDCLFIMSELAPKFKLESMGMDYLLPVCIGVCEMLYLTEEIPAKVSINEAIEMAKVYGDESSKKVVNGVMNKFYKDIDTYKKLLLDNPVYPEFSLFQK